MPFGKHKGQDIEDIPSDYLRWLAANCDDDQIATIADEEYTWRSDNGCHIWEN